MKRGVSHGDTCGKSVQAQGRANSGHSRGSGGDRGEITDMLGVGGGEEGLAAQGLCILF